MVTNLMDNHLHMRPLNDLALNRKHDHSFGLVHNLKHLHSPKSALNSSKRLPLNWRRLTFVSVLIFFCWVFFTSDSFFLLWLRWTTFGGPRKPDPSLTQNCPARDYSLPMIVVIPLISTQFNRLEWNLERWVKPRYHPCPANFAGEKPHLSFFFDRPLTDSKTAEAANEIRKLLDQPKFYRLRTTCFSAISVTSANLTAAQTRNSYTMDLVHNLVQTGGSNRLFERAFSTFGGGRYRHMFWMEPDAYPISSGWLNAVETESRWGDFWMRGSTMRHVPRFNIGLEPYRSRYQRHINGNAIYALDDACFASYRQETRKVYGDGAFDVAMNLYLLGMERIMTFQSVAHRFQKSRVIADVGVSIVDLERLKEEFPGTFLVHGKAGFVRFPRLNFMQY